MTTTKLKDEVPLGRIGDVSEIAALVAMLVSRGRRLHHRYDHAYRRRQADELAMNISEPVNFPWYYNARSTWSEIWRVTIRRRRISSAACSAPRATNCARCKIAASCRP